MPGLDQQRIGGPPAIHPQPTLTPQCPSGKVEQGFDQVGFGERIGQDLLAPDDLVGFGERVEQHDGTQLGQVTIGPHGLQHRGQVEVGDQVVGAVRERGGQVGVPVGEQ